MIMKRKSKSYTKESVFSKFKGLNMKTEEKREVKEKKTVPDDEANKEIPIKPVKTNVTKPNIKTTDEIMAQKSNWSKTVKSGREKKPQKN